MEYVHSVWDGHTPFFCIVVQMNVRKIPLSPRCKTFGMIGVYIIVSKGIDMKLLQDEQRIKNRTGKPPNQCVGV
jgi:hypothetical protein